MALRPLRHQAPRAMRIPVEDDPGLFAGCPQRRLPPAAQECPQRVRQVRILVVHRLRVERRQLVVPLAPVVLQRLGSFGRRDEGSGLTLAASVPRRTTSGQPHVRLPRGQRTQESVQLGFEKRRVGGATRLFPRALDGVVDARDRAASKLAGSLVLRPLPRSIGGSRGYLGRQRLEGWLRQRGGPAYRGWPAALSATLASRTEHSLPGSPGLMPKNPSARYGQDPGNLRASRKSSPSERKCRVLPSIAFRNTRRSDRCCAVNCV